MVYPSGAARATRLTPVVPPAPPMFSTRIGWPSVARIDSSMVRTMVSTAPPAASGMTTVIGFDGKVCACATPHAAKIAKTESMSLFIVTVPKPLEVIGLDVRGLGHRHPFCHLGAMQLAERRGRL